MDRKTGQIKELTETVKILRKKNLELKEKSTRYGIALEKILDKFKRPFYNGCPKRYVTIDEIADMALYGKG